MGCGQPGKPAKRPINFMTSKISMINCVSVNMSYVFSASEYLIFNMFTQQGHIRDMKWSVENPKQFVNKYNGQPIKAIIEYVRDGSTVRLCLLPDFYTIIMMMSGIRVSMGYSLIKIKEKWQVEVIKMHIFDYLFKSLKKFVITINKI